MSTRQMIRGITLLLLAYTAGVFLPIGSLQWSTLFGGIALILFLSQENGPPSAGA
jgi:hypothetical protein